MRCTLQDFGQSQFEECLGLLSAYAWEAVEELLERIPGLQVNNKAIYRNPGAREYGNPYYDFGIRVVVLRTMMSADAIT